MIDRCEFEKKIITHRSQYGHVDLYVDCFYRLLQCMKDRGRF